ncbi:hypothetical protein [Asaia prunellae]|uniref:hypothetical protein n=1 Tax=Asaia prunellae TaxID=610245 RepID=UPI0011DD958E|nr:hypothetical protein [Asaia prunellae]
MTSVLDPDDARDVEAINGFTFKELMPVISKVDSAIYPLGRETNNLSLTIDEWLILRDCYITSVGGIGIWRTYESISPFTEDDFNECEERFFLARKLADEDDYCDEKLPENE